MYLYSFSSSLFINSVDREKFSIFAVQPRQPVIVSVITEYMMTKEAGSSIDIPDLFAADIESNLSGNTILN
jgi:hypothetical protein